MGPWNSKVERIEDLEVMNERRFRGTWKVIGSGGGGEVYKARHRQWRKDVAVKILCRYEGLEEVKKTDLVSELKLMLSAESLYTVKVLGVFKGCTPFSPVVQWGLVMELMDGGSLNSLQVKRKNQPLPSPLVLRLAHQVAHGMEYLHTLKPTALIHKDLKPDNILLDSDLNVKITDFGISKFVDTVTTECMKGLGTSFFAPPEAEQGGATPAYDVYSYAILLWTILNPAYIIPGGHQSYPVRPSLEDVSMEVPGLKELVDLMVRCWNQDPTKRPTFAECTDVTGALYWRHGWSGIDDAVHKVKQQLRDGPQPGVPQPGVPQPDVPQPGVPQPDVPQPDVTQPGVPQPGVPQPDVPQPGVPQPDVPQPDVLQCDFQRLTLDTNTAYRALSLSENKRKVTWDGQVHSYPDHPDRFDVCPQVLSAESLDERCYTEVQFSGMVVIGVTSRDISRKGDGDDCVVGEYEQSWSLGCSDVHHNNGYYVCHNSEVAVVPLRPDGSNRVAVYLDRPAGTLSFYRVSEDTLSHLYTYQHTFTEPLYAGFWVMPGSSVSLCEDRQAVRTDML